MNATAVQVAATRDVVLAAGSDLNLRMSEHAYTEAWGTKAGHVGLMSSGGLGVLIGSRTQEAADTINDTSDAPTAR
ncbi:hypothetical protein [Dyella silvatica]|uniref:hypothetical protein n=1 Tax=Dyella silvatica TaxID=2992128 RepID=UPI002253FE92|nr:hypothetical protein [Dyella silvatica]